MVCKDKYESERFVLSHTCDAVIMGGYLRDLVLDRPWKDIDLFVSVPELEMQHYRTTGVYVLAWVSPTNKTVTTIWTMVSDVRYDSDFAVFSCATLPGVQLILYTKYHDPRKSQFETAMYYMRHEFPCSLSKVAMALIPAPRYRSIHLSVHFENSVLDRVLEFYAGCPQEYRDRMASYFPDYTHQMALPF